VGRRADLKYPLREVGLPLALTVASTFTPVVVRASCLAAAFLYSVFIYYVDFANRRIARTLIAAVCFAALYGGLFWLATPEIHPGQHPARVARAPAAASPHAIPPPTPPEGAGETRPTARIGLAMGANAPELKPDLPGLCASPAITCLGEEGVQGKTLSLFLQPKGSGWIVILITVYGDDNIIEDFHVLVSTTAEGVGLDYVGQRQLPQQKSLEFGEIIAYSTALEREPYKYAVDLTVATGVRTIPITIAAWGSDMKTHTVTAQFHVIRTKH
jgi:hypothetical protein